MATGNSFLRRALLNAPRDAIYVSSIAPREFINAIGMIPRRDLTLVGPSILVEESLAEIDRPVYVASDVVLTEAQRKALAYHQRRIA